MWYWSVFSLAAAFAVWATIRGRAARLRLLLVLVPAALFCVFVGSPNLWAQSLAGYPNDSFWDLGTFGRTGVILISSLGLLALFLLIGRIAIWLRGRMGGRGFVPALLIGWGIYGLVYSLSPQAFYTLYQVIFPDLPAQIVVKHLVDFERLIRVARLSEGGSLSDHLAGVALWGIGIYVGWIVFGGLRPVPKGDH